MVCPCPVRVDNVAVVGISFNKVQYRKVHIIVRFGVVDIQYLQYQFQYKLRVQLHPDAFYCLGYI